MSKPISLGGDGQEFLDRPLREVAEDELAQLFLRAAKPASEWFVGMEVELFGFSRAELRPATHDALAGVLAELGARLGMTPEHEPNGALVGLRGGGQLISLEPGGQLELATRPHRSLKKLGDELHAYARDLREVASARGIGFWALGHQPFVTRQDAPHMPKPRYDRMQAYLAQVGTRGLDMMHLTGSVQSTVDFRSEEELVEKVRTAARVSPFLSALVSASPFTAGRPNGFKSMRYEIWLDTDAARCGIWPEMLDARGLTMARYLARARTVSPMFFIRDGAYRAAEARPFAHFVEHGFEGTTVTVRDLLDHLTTFFPEIRPKNYVELRGADCVTPDKAVGVAGFWRGILDDEPTRRAVEARLAPMDFEALRALQPQISRLGMEAMSPVGPVKDIARWLVEQAYERLGRSAPDCAECLVPLLEQAVSGRSPADDLLEVAAKTSVAEALRQVEV
jgi:glutamate--cysteine ligase